MDVLVESMHVSVFAENYFPTGLTPYKKIYSTLPNFVLKLKTILNSKFFSDAHIYHTKMVK